MDPAPIDQEDREAAGRGSPQACRRLPGGDDSLQGFAGVGGSSGQPSASSVTKALQQWERLTASHSSLLATNSASAREAEAALSPPPGGHTSPPPHRGRRVSKSMSPSINRPSRRTPLPQDWSPLHQMPRGKVSYAAIATAKRLSLSADSIEMEETQELAAKGTSVSSLHLSSRTCSSRRLSEGQMMAVRRDMSRRPSGSGSILDHVPGLALSPGTLARTEASFHGSRGDGMLFERGRGDTPTYMQAPAAASMFLSSDEVEELSLRVAYLQHYWALAARYGVFPSVAAERARHWSQQLSSARRLGNFDIADAARRLTAPEILGIAGSSNDGTPRGEAGVESRVSPDRSPGAALGWSTDSGEDSGMLEEDLEAADSKRFGGTAADVVEVERATREMLELRVPERVLLAMTNDARTMKLASCQDTSLLLWKPELLELSLQEGEEIQYQRHWAAYLWGRAAACGVEPELSVERAEYWGRRLDTEPRLKDLTDLQQAFEELQLESIEVKLWRARGDAAAL
mmetsp:Transcript_4904/g.13688  ORF Transcript_4904/g.13688 Transcript_4904/m.13688 type:complete len:516 (+) Transcript_4904:112-1659(+)|eukprot:CAMPEP_0117667840 /NCGR_PEP_ID=MMETSP0804-20121206/11200_1 /TAXON_ID=1074897 /ORGANISM="Tetraselmis astigmatica, Strain CCMP880" /LENGTH=515 /DNA_ID=CAMNT_0005475631 /DNA_START=59 /DNA_END=1606 /DNA_ORIENTATION=+